MGETGTHWSPPMTGTGTACRTRTGRCPSTRRAARCTTLGPWPLGGPSRSGFPARSRAGPVDRRDRSGGRTMRDDDELFPAPKEQFARPAGDLDPLTADHVIGFELLARDPKPSVAPLLELGTLACRLDVGHLLAQSRAERPEVGQQPDPGHGPLIESDLVHMEFLADFASVVPGEPRAAHVH